MKPTASLLVVLGCAIGLSGADPVSGADVLNRWVGGKWVSEGQFVDSAYSSANKVSAIARCAWSPDRIFVVCDQDINFGGTQMRDLSIYTFASKTDKYYFYGISLGDEKPRSTALEIADNGQRWSYSSSQEIKGKTVQFRTTNRFQGDDAVQWWSEFSADEGKTWTRTAQGTETRQK